MNTTKILAAVAALATGSAAASSITVDNVAQRWPWNNKIDITYTVSGGQDVSLGVYARIVFTAHIGGTDYIIDGVNDIGASASDGQHTVTWTVPTGIRASGCTVTAQLLSADNPSGDDYMVVDLDTGAVSYEGLLDSQDASNVRYNTDTYKTTNLVLRKVPAGRTYPTGDNSHYSSVNTARTWTPAHDYYIGIFPVTQSQYKKIYGSNPSYCKSSIEGNTPEHRPVECVSWNALRVSTTAPNESIPKVNSLSGTFFQRLNFKTGLYFDLPTEVMFEIAERAGATTTYFWGETMVTNYVVCEENSGNSTVAVGSRLPNNWGLFDMAGNTWEWCLDVTVDNDNLALLPDVFVPQQGTGTKRRTTGGGAFTYSSSTDRFHVSFRAGGENAQSYNQYIGFRVAHIVP